MLDPDEPEPYDLSARKLRRVGTGLRLVYLGIMLSLFAVFVCPILIVLLLPNGGPANGPPGPANLALSLEVMLALLLFCSLLQIYGRWRCRDLPRGLNGAAALRTTLAVDAWGLAIMLWAGFDKVAVRLGLGAAGGPPDWLASKVQLAGLFAPVFFLIFLRAVALYIDEPKFAASARSILVWGIVCVVALAVVLGGWLAAAEMGLRPGMPPPKQAEGMLAVVGLTTMFLIPAALVTSFRYLYLLQRLPLAALRYADRLDAAALDPLAPR